MSTQTLLAAIDAHLRVSGIKETTFGRLAVNDGKFVPRLRKGGRVWPETEGKVLDFIEAHQTKAAA